MAAANNNLVRTFPPNKRISNVPAERLFNSLTKNPQYGFKNKIPDIQKIQPFAGPGGVGKFIFVTLGRGLASRSKVLMFDYIDQANMEYEYSVVAASDFDESTEKISYKTKIFADPDGETIAKITTKLYLKKPSDLSDSELLEEIKIQGLDTFNAVKNLSEEK